VSTLPSPSLRLLTTHHEASRMRAPRHPRRRVPQGQRTPRKRRRRNARCLRREEGSAQVSNPDRCQLSYPLTTLDSSRSPSQRSQTPTNRVSPITPFRSAHSLSDDAWTTTPNAKKRGPTTSQVHVNRVRPQTRCIAPSSPGY